MRPSDAAAVFEYASDPLFTKYLQWPTHRSITDAEDFTRAVHARWDDGDEYCWALTFPDQDAALGSIACRIRGHMADIGYGIARHLWGQGYNTEAVAGLLEWLVSLETIHRIWATCDIENVGSARVLEKVGMIREGVQLGTSPQFAWKTSARFLWVRMGARCLNHPRLFRIVVRRELNSDLRRQ